MTSHLDNMANELASEVLSEAADTFFGQRKDLELETDLFQQKIEELRELGTKVSRIQKRLHAVLLEPTVAKNFYHALDLPLPENIEAVAVHELAPWISLPFAWSLRGKYCKALLASYALFQKAAHDYMHGGYKDDTQHPHKKVARFGYLSLRSWAERLNGKIRIMNREQAPSEVLQFMKRLDVQGCEKEKSMGASCEVNRDSGLLYSRIDFSAFNLPFWPTMPPAQTAQQRIKHFCKLLFPDNRLKIRDLLTELAAQRKKRVFVFFRRSSR